MEPRYRSRISLPFSPRLGRICENLLRTFDSLPIQTCATSTFVFAHFNAGNQAYSIGLPKLICFLATSAALYIKPLARPGARCPRPTGQLLALSTTLLATSGASAMRSQS